LSGSEKGSWHLLCPYAADANNHQRQLFDDSLRAALSVAEIRGLVTSLGFEGNSVLATTDRHWSWSAVTR